jgi:hypothetical protein
LSDPKTLTKPTRRFIDGIADQIDPLTEDVLLAITTIDRFPSTLPQTDDRASLPVQFGVFCSALIQFTSRHHLRYPIGDEDG